MCRRRFSLDSVFGHPLDRIASGMPFDRADTLLLRERGDDCSPLFFVDDSGAPARLGVPEQGERVAYFSPVRSFIGPSVSLEDMLPNAFDHIIMEERVARFDISPHPGYYRRTETDGSLSEAELYPGCKIRVDGPTLREDAIVRAALDRSRAERIFETRFERLMMDRKASFVTESEYDKRLR